MQRSQHAIDGGRDNEVADGSYEILDDFKLEDFVVREHIREIVEQDLGAKSVAATNKPTSNDAAILEYKTSKSSEIQLEAFSEAISRSEAINVPQTESKRNNKTKFGLAENLKPGPLKLKKGKISVEVWLSDGNSSGLGEIQDVIKELFSSGRISHFHIGEELLSETYKNLFPDGVKSVRVQDYQGISYTGSLLLNSDGFFDTFVHAYKMCPRSAFLDDANSELFGEMIELPSLEFEGIWERLIFEGDFRNNMLYIMTDMAQASKTRCPSQSSRLNRLFLLSGPPGTGKTTLIHGLAQKISIRLSHIYERTIFISINTAAILSEYFGLTTKRVAEVFQKLKNLCEASPCHFFCVVLDEVETLVASRQTCKSRGDIQEAVRATNEFLKGFDKLKHCPNYVIMCTTNLQDSLDLAFVDRCGFRFVFEQPTLPVRYEILRGGFMELIQHNIIKTDCHIPKFRFAVLDLEKRPTSAGDLLYQLSFAAKEHTARELSQLPEASLMGNLRGEPHCSLEEAMGFAKTFLVTNKKSQGKKRKRKDYLESDMDSETVCETASIAMC